ncbi:MAG: VOC family protein [Nitrospiraceae bacterium]|nr:MAG: VOC family protein [Nitrospiraceae bacterium]
MIKYSGINHIALATKDMDTTIRFWRDLLGMRLISGIGKKGNRQYFFELSSEVLIAFFEWPEADPAPDKDPGRPAKGPIVFDHVCIEMTDGEQFWALKDRLNAADVWVTEAIDNGFIHSIFTTDPNGIQIEFCYRIDKFDVRNKFRMKDPMPSNVTKEGPGPFPEKWPSVENPEPADKRKVYPGELKKLFEGED